MLRNTECYGMLRNTDSWRFHPTCNHRIKYSYYRNSRHEPNMRNSYFNSVINTQRHFFSAINVPRHFDYDTKTRCSLSPSLSVLTYLNKYMILISDLNEHQIKGKTVFSRKIIWFLLIKMFFLLFKATLQHDIIVEPQ